MWKDFFYFSKGQRFGIIVLIALIIIVLVVNIVMPLFFPAEKLDGLAFLKEVETFKKSLVSIDSIREIERQKKYEERYKYSSTYSTGKNNTTYKLFVFDPNSIDSVAFIQLGLKSYVASNILKYRHKGGKFRIPSDFGKVYGISPEKFKELEPYISIKEIILTQKKDTVICKPKEFKKNIIVELNSADTTLLMQIKGIGSGYAKGIVRFRNETGGFISVDQLREVFGMRQDNFERIKPFCTVNSTLVKKIKVNIASVDRLNSHPYINFYQAKALFELRRKKGKLHSMNDLNLLSEFSTDDIDKISPYLNFE